MRFGFTLLRLAVISENNDQMQMIITITINLLIDLYNLSLIICGYFNIVEKKLHAEISHKVIINQNNKRISLITCGVCNEIILPHGSQRHPYAARQ